MDLGFDGVRLKMGRQPQPEGLDALLALGALFVEQFGHRFVLLRLQEAKREVFELPLDLTDAQPMGQRRKHLHRFQRQRLGACVLARRVVAQGLQPRGQTQQHHPQIARKRQQHLANQFGLLLALLAFEAGFTRRALDLHELARAADQAGVRRPEGLGHHLLGFLQVIAGVDQVCGRAQGRRRAHLIEDLAHAVGVLQCIFASVQRLSGQQGLGERACTLALQLTFVVGKHIALQ